METSRNALAGTPLFELKASLGPLWPVTSKDPARHLTKIRKKMRGLSSLLFRKTEMGGGGRPIKHQKIFGLRLSILKSSHKNSIAISMPSPHCRISQPPTPKLCPNTLVLLWVVPSPAARQQS